MGAAKRSLFAVTLGLSAVASSGVGCGGAPPQPQPAPSAFAVLAIDGPPPQAELFVDDHPAGAWARTGGVFRLQAGTRHLRIEAPGFLTYRFEASVVAGETYDVSVELWPCFAGVDPGCQTAP